MHHLLSIDKNYVSFINIMHLWNWLSLNMRLYSLNGFHITLIKSHFWNKYFSYIVQQEVQTSHCLSLHYVLNILEPGTNQLYLIYFLFSLSSLLSYINIKFWLLWDATSTDKKTNKQKKQVTISDPHFR